MQPSHKRINSSLDLVRLEKITERASLSVEDLKNLYTMALLENLDSLKTKISGDKLEVALLIRKMLDEWVLVDTIQDLIHNYGVKHDLLSFVNSHKIFFSSDKDYLNLKKFISGEVNQIKISSIFDLSLFEVLTYPDNLKNLYILLNSYELMYDFLADQLPKIQVEILEK